MQDARSTTRMPRVGDRVDGAEPPPELVPTSVLEAQDDVDDSDADLEQGPETGLEAEFETGFETAAEHEEREPVPAPSYAQSEPSPPAPMHAVSSTRDRDDDTSSFDLVPDEHHGRRGSRRRGLGLMVTGGCAGVAVVGFLVLGGGGSGKSAGVAVKSSGTVSVDGSPAGTASAGFGQNLGTASFAAPTGSSAPPSTSSASATATHTASMAPSSQAPTTTAPTSAGPSVSASRTHSSPSSSPSKTFCLLFC